MNELWKSVLGELEVDNNITAANFKTWLSETELLSIDENIAVIGTKNQFVSTQLKKKYYQIIQKVIQKNGYNPNELIFEVISSKKKINDFRESSIDQSEKTKPQARAIDLISKKSKKASDNLNPKYTFANFVVGSSNDLAYAAAKAVADNPGKKYNPLYFYGGVGLGKTHLMQAIGNQIKEKNPELSILYITIENFYKDFIENVRFKKQGYADKYRNVDVLIVDDMQFISGKEKSQEEFFHTFNELHQANKQIIISSDRAPKSIPTLTDRLRSRFEWGMTIDIQMPDLETRQAIIEAKAELSGFKLDQEMISYLAANIKTNIRELEGTLNQILMLAELRGLTPDIEMVKGMIASDIKSNRPQHLTDKKIIEKTCKFYQISKEDILSKSRLKDINHARQVACYLMKYELKMSFPQIGKIFNRDHSTIMNSVSKIEKGKKLDNEIREQLNILMDLMYE